MSESEDVEWITAGRFPRCQVWLGAWSASYYALNYARSGRVSLKEEGGQSVVKEAPVAWWTCPGNVYHYGSRPSECWDQSFVTFRGPVADRWRQGGKLPESKVKPFWSEIHDTERFSRRMDDLIRLVLEGSGRHDWMHCQLESLLVLCREEVIVPPPAHQPKFQILVEQLRSDPAQPMDWNQEARSLGMSPVHFRRLFKEMTGYAPNQYQIHARMLEAARRLRRSTDPIKQIAEEVGYENVYYFTKLFRARFNLPPGQYRIASRMGYG